MFSRRNLNARRIGAGFSAQVFNQLVTIAVQLLQVPVLLRGWGTDTYGAWLVLASIPAFLTLSDLGFTLVAKNEMTIRVARRDFAGAVETFQTVFGLLLLVSAAIFGVTILSILAFNFTDLFHLGTVSEIDSKCVLLFSIANVLMCQFFLLICAGIRCEAGAPVETLWGAAARLSEGLIVMAVATAHGGILAAAIFALVSRILFLIAARAYLRSKSPWISLSVKHCKKSEMRRLLHPSASFMSVAIANALLLQGPVTILGSLSTPAMVVIYSATRTLVRAGTAAANMLNFTFVAEYSMAFGKGDKKSFKLLELIHLGAVFALIFVYSISILVFGEYLLHLYTGGKVDISIPFFPTLVAAVAAEMVWSALMTPLGAVNHHTAAGYSFSGLSVVGIVICVVLAPSHSLTGIAAAILAVHLCMCLIMLRGAAALQTRLANIDLAPGLPS